VLGKHLAKKGERTFINVADKSMDNNPNFKLFFFTQLPKPKLSHCGWREQCTLHAKCCQHIKHTCIRISYAHGFST